MKPIVERIFEDLGRAAHVEVLEDPHLRGIDEALDAGTIAGILEERAMFQLFLLLVDRDCNDVRAKRRNNEALAAQREAEHTLRRGGRSRTGARVKRPHPRRRFLRGAGPPALMALEKLPRA